MLKDEDFVNDAIDAGEIGAGHQVTALYEIIPTGTEDEFSPKNINLKYSKNGNWKQFRKRIGNHKIPI